MTRLLATWACCPGYTVIAVSLSRKNTASLAALITHHEDSKGDCMGGLFHISWAARTSCGPAWRDQPGSGREAAV